MLAGRIEPSHSTQPEVVESPAVTSPRDRNSVPKDAGSSGIEPVEAAHEVDAARAREGNRGGRRFSGAACP